MPVNSTGLSARISAPTSNRSRQLTEKQSAFTMDASVYDIILGELEELNCSLIEHFQDTFYENASLALLSADGKMDLFFSFHQIFLVLLHLENT